MPEETAMATNWNAILSNTNNLQDVLSILKKVLASLDIKADFSDLEGAIEIINGLDINVQQKLGTLAQELESFSQEKTDALDSLNSAKEEILTQVNNITTVNSIDELNTTEKWPGRTVYVKDVANFECVNDEWVLISTKAESSSYKTSNVHDVLSRTQTLYDNGAERPHLGYDPINDVEIYNIMSQLFDQELLLNGGLHIAKKFRGLRRNITAIAARGGMPLIDGNFNDQVTGVSNSRELASYGTNDGVTAFFDAELPILEDWENVTNAAYTQNTLVLDKTIYASTLSNTRIGDVIQTKHGVKCWGIVTSINESSGIISVDEWATTAGTTVPVSGVGCFINLINKAWALNANTVVHVNSEGNNAVVAEFGLQLKKAVTANGIDMVLLSASVVDGIAAYLARSGAINRSWLYGFNAQGCRFNFFSSSGEVQPYAGFAETSNAVVGLKLLNKNTYSMLVSKSNDLTDNTVANSPLIFGPLGQVYRQPKRLMNISASAMLSPVYPTYYILSSGLTLTLPAKSSHTAGHYYEIVFLNAGSYTFNTYNNESTVNGNASLTITVNEERIKYEVIFDGSSWQLHKG